jgi:polyhydroxybutyrate depolymerase
MKEIKNDVGQNAEVAPHQSVAQQGDADSRFELARAVVVANRMAESHTVQSNGISRDYLLYAPPPQPTSGPRPLVVELHGSGLSAEQQMRSSGFLSMAQEHDFVVAAAQALIPLRLFDDFPPGFAWNVPGVPLVHQKQAASHLPDDIRFIRDLIADVGCRLAIDPARVYVVGFSGGGRLASYLAFLLSDIVAGIGAVSGLRIPAINVCNAPCPIIAFHGQMDQLNPFDGGPDARWREPVLDTATYLAVAQGCTSSPNIENDHGITKLSFQDDLGASRLVQYVINTGNHSWPGSVDSEHRVMFGEPAMAVNATREIWQFFSSAGAFPDRNTSSSFRPIS